MLSSISALILLISPIAVFAADPQLVHVANLRFNVAPSVDAGQTPLGTYVYASINSGSFNTTDYVPPGYPSVGPLVTELLPGGNDYARGLDDGSFRLDVEAAFQGVNVPNLFRYSSTGYVQPFSFGSGAFETEFGDLDAFQSIQINTDSEEYGWLNSAALLGQERLIGSDSAPDTVELRIYRIEVKTRGQ